MTSEQPASTATYSSSGTVDITFGVTAIRPGGVDAEVGGDELGHRGGDQHDPVARSMPAATSPPAMRAAPSRRRS